MSLDMKPEVHDMSIPAIAAAAAVRQLTTGWLLQETPSNPNSEMQVCEVCQAEFTSFDTLLLHRLCHFNTRHVCYVCDGYFSDTGQLVKHVGQQHRELSRALGYYKNEVERPFSCSICIQRFCTNTMLDRHERLHIRNDEHCFSCKICALEFSEHDDLLTHLSGDQHRAMKVRIQGVFVCVDCRRVFPSRDAYAMHALMRAQSEVCSSSGSSEPSLGTVHDTPTVTIKREPPSPPEERHAKKPRGIASSHYRTMATESLKRAYAKSNWFTSYNTPIQSPMLSVMDGGSTGTTEMPVTCLICYASLKSCDALAMHMMESHAHYQFANSTPSTMAVSNNHAPFHSASPTPAAYEDVRLKRCSRHPRTAARSTPRPKSSSSSAYCPPAPAPMIRCKSSSAIYDSRSSAALGGVTDSRRKSLADECRQCGVSFCEHTAWNLLTSKSTSMLLLQQKAGEPFSSQRMSRILAAKMAAARVVGSATPAKQNSYRVVGAVEPRAIQTPVHVPNDHMTQGHETTAIVELMTAHKDQLSMCAHCRVVFLDRTLYHLHMGTHNRNDPWQCNLCGHRCDNVHEFTSHVIHYK